MVTPIELHTWRRPDVSFTLFWNAINNEKRSPAHQPVITDRWFDINKKPLLSTFWFKSWLGQFPNKPVDPTCRLDINKSQWNLVFIVYLTFWVLCRLLVFYLNGYTHLSHKLNYSYVQIIYKRSIHIPINPYSETSSITSHNSCRNAIKWRKEFAE